MNILIVDDDADDAFLFSEAVKEIAPDIICHAADSCQLAKLFLEENDITPEFIFLDAYMYPLGGKDCLIQLSQIQKLKDTKIIIHSGVLSPSQVDEFMALGADGIMMKARSYEALCKALGEILIPI